MENSPGFHERIAFFERIARDWIHSGVATIACGGWNEVGAIAELIPRGNVELLPAAYQECFAGVRELRFTDAPHHIHFDLGRIYSARYCVTPSVCFGGRPSFEVRLLATGAGGTKTQRSSLAMMLTAPYTAGQPDLAQVTEFFVRARDHIRARPDLVEIEIAPEVMASADSGTILAALRAAVGRDDEVPSLREALAWIRPGAPGQVNQADGKVAARDPALLPLLRDALQFRESSLVIYRERTLVELQTERLAGVFRYEEGGHVSWQVGEFEDHHCHLALGEITGVLFSAEPVSCQGGRLNYTVWFLVDGPCGNPYREEGYFSVVLNRPYEHGRPRRGIIGQVFELYSRYAHEPWVSADAEFLRALEEATRTAGAQDGHASSDARAVVAY